jgi:hypothetical protein
MKESSGKARALCLFPGQPLYFFFRLPFTFIFAIQADEPLDSGPLV